MAAYAALVSLMHTIELIQHHPRPPIYLDKKQAEDLIEKVTLLQDFLESYDFHFCNKEADSLLSHMAHVAYAAEDIIESHVMDQIIAQSRRTQGENISYIEFYQGLQTVIEDMDFIMKELMEIQEKTGIQDQLHRNSIPVADSLRSPSTGQNTIVGFDDVLNEIMDKLAGQQSDRQIVPIVGMGGIGKTTLARNVYENPLIAQYFDIHAWIIISQEYSVRDILLGVLLCQKNKENMEKLSEKQDEELGEILYKSLWGRRYLVVMDDIWSIDAWYKVKFFFPDNNNGSRIMITTRLSNVALDLSGTSGHKMSFLDEDKIWDLLCKKVFGEESCPHELEAVGKKIARSCKRDFLCLLL